MKDIPTPVAAAHRTMQKEFVDRLKCVASREGLTYGETLSRFLEAAFRALLRPTIIGQAMEQNEAEYLKLIDRFRDETRKQSAGDFASMLSQVVLALDAEQTDFIGPIYSEVASNEWAGQFFTPAALSRVIAEMTIGDNPRKIIDQTGRRYLTLAEPACGVGGMVLEADRVLKERGIKTHREAHWTMVDVDARCIHAAYIQATLCGISADVIHGNTLSMKTWGVYRTLAAVLHPKIEAQSPEVSNSIKADFQLEMQL